MRSDKVTQNSIQNSETQAHNMLLFTNIHTVVESQILAIRNSFRIYHNYYTKIESQHDFQAIRTQSDKNTQTSIQK